ncbi:UNVERIFIED_CONTAM: hypothetical protein K2H54_045489, partial [Gekko kuhli]
MVSNDKEGSNSLCDSVVENVGIAPPLTYPVPQIPPPPGWTTHPHEVHLYGTPTSVGVTEGTSRDSTLDTSPAGAPSAMDPTQFGQWLREHQAQLVLDLAQQQHATQMSLMHELQQVLANQGNPEGTSNPLGAI